MASSAITLAATTQTSATAAATPTPSAGFSFHTLLSDLNPLQYIPGVGALYRAITGDEGNEDLRFVASLGTSFALGGPLGLGITVAERLTGIDPEKIGRHLLSSLLHPAAASQTAAQAATTGTASQIAASQPGIAQTSGTQATTEAGRVGTTARPWTAEELSAYGVSVGRDGELSAGTVASADVLNTLELKRLSTRTA